MKTRHFADWLRNAAVLLLVGGGAASLGCNPGPGTIVLEARQGSVVDRDTGAPLAGASVFQVYWGRGVAGEPRPAYALRWTRSDEAGAFVFEEQLSSEPRSWVLETDAAEYGFFHPDYGLVRMRVASGGAVSLSGPRLDEARRRAEELSLCGSRPADRVIAEVARMHCPRPPRN